MVLSDSGIFWSTGELREFAGEVNGPYWALVERGEKVQEVARASPCPNRIGQGVEAPPISFSPSLLSFFPTPKRKGNLTRTWES